jgi:hypothetical protein
MWQAVCVVGRKLAGVGSSGGGCTNNNNISNCLPVIFYSQPPKSKLTY